MDIKSPEERSKNMSRIKNGRTKPEMFIRTMLYRHGLRFRVNYSELPGKPDLYFIRQKAAVFIHGCYWHATDVNMLILPTNQNSGFPSLRNRKRDEK